MKLKNFYSEHESLILGTGFIMVLLAVWESVPLWTTLPRGMALFFTTPSKIASAFYVLLLNGEIEKHFSIFQRPVGSDFVAHDRFVLLADLADGLVASTRVLTRDRTRPVTHV